MNKRKQAYGASLYPRRGATDDGGSYLKHNIYSKKEG